MNRLVFVLLAAGLATALLAAGPIEPLLLEQMAKVDETQKLGVMIALTEQLDAQSIINTIKDKEQRWTTTVTELKSMAQTTQAGLLSELRSFEMQGKVQNIEGLWIVNAVYCEAVPEVISAVAERPEVWFVQWDLIPTENALGTMPNDERRMTNAAAADVLDDGPDTIEWNVKKVKADSVWRVHGYTGNGVVIGNIDTGCDYTHPDLAGHMWTDPNYPYYGWNFEQSNNNPMDVNGHGTHTCGTNAGNGTGGDTTGMAPKARIMTCRTKTSISTPYPDTIAENTVMMSMQFCVAPPLSPANHAHLLTMSLGWLHAWSPRRALWRQSVTNVAAAGLPYFIATGNEASTAPPHSCRTPGDCPGPWKHPAEAPGGLGGTISIGATDNADAIASFSSRGPVAWDTIAPYNDYPYPPGLLHPDFCAPGVNVTSTKRGGGYTQMSGTSMATPCAAGVCALMLEKNPNLLPEEVDEVMQSSVLPLGTPPKNNTFGTGRIDAMLCIANTPLPGPRHDVAMDKVLSPGDRIDPRTPLAPVAVVKNRGTYNEPNVVVHCKVESLGTQVYYQTRTITLLDSVGVDTVTFPAWNVGPGSQTYNLTFWHYQVPDTNRSNDTITKTTTTRGHDVRAAGMNVSGRVKANSPLTPRVTLASADYTERNFKAFCLIDSAGTVVYRDSAAVDSVPEQGSRSFSFPSNWNVGPVGATYDAKMWHNCGPDENRANDTILGTAQATDQVRILMLYADYGAPESTLGVRLRALGDSIEYMSVQTATPTLAQLTPYDAVGAQSNYTYGNATALGDTLAAYVVVGGGVVLGHFGFATGWAMAGRIMTESYATITPGANTQVNTTLGWRNTVHPVMAGVDSVREYYAGGGRFETTAESVARWADGRSYVAVSQNQKVVGLNQYPGIYSRNPPQRGGDWALVWHNAFMFVSGSGVGVKEFDPSAPALNVVLSTAPNPAQRRATVNYMVPAGSRVEIGMFDLSGRLVKTLVCGPAKPDLQRVVWGMTDNQGRKVANGVYFCKLVSGDKTETRKVVVE